MAQIALTGVGASYDATASDFAAGAVNMVLQSIGTTAVMACRACGCETAVLTGLMPNLPQAAECFTLFNRLHGIQFIIPDGAAFATSIGAAMLCGEKPENQSVIYFCFPQWETLGAGRKYHPPGKYH